MEQPTPAASTNVPITSIGDQHGLSPGWSALFAEAAAVCFSSQDHAGIASIRVYGDEECVVDVIYDEPGELVVNNHQDENEATENGACAISILLCRLLKGHAVIEQAVQMDGIDYWVGDAEPGRPMAKKARLEATGIRAGDVKAVNARFRQKLSTTSKSDGDLPAIITVVEFSNPMARLETKPCTQ